MRRWGWVVSLAAAAALAAMPGAARAVRLDVLTIVFEAPDDGGEVTFSASGQTRTAAQLTEAVSASAGGMAAFGGAAVVHPAGDGQALLVWHGVNRLLLLGGGGIPAAEGTDLRADILCVETLGDLTEETLARVRPRAVVLTGGRLSADEETAMEDLMRRGVEVYAPSLVGGIILRSDSYAMTANPGALEDAPEAPQTPAVPPATRTAGGSAQYGRTNTPAVNVRAKADANGARVAVFTKGTNFEILDTVYTASGLGWHQIRRGGVQGYIRVDLVEPISQADYLEDVVVVPGGFR
jgi:hypothetical protein